MIYALGVDPGIANTGLAIITYDNFKFGLKDIGIVKTDADLPETDRLGVIYNTIQRLLVTHPEVGIVAVEKVFHNKNVTSSISTGKVMGITALAAWNYSCDYYEFTPQQVKKASGLDADADKVSLKKIAGKMFNTQFQTHHEADAVLCAIAGVLKHRSAKLQEDPTHSNFNEDHIAERLRGER